MGWQDSKAAIEMRDVIFKVAQQTVETRRPAPAYATVDSIDRANRRCSVTFVGDASPVTIPMGSIQPAAVGQIVRVAGVLGDRYIEDVLGNAYVLGLTNRSILPPLSIGGTLSVVTGKIRFYAPWAFDITNVISSVGTAPTGASVKFDLNKNGTTIFTTQANRPTIAAGTFVDLSSVPDVTHFDPGDYLTIDVDEVGSSVPGTDGLLTIEFV